MDIQLEKTSLISTLQGIEDIDVIQRIKLFLKHEIDYIGLSSKEKIMLDSRLLQHKINPTDGIDGFMLLDKLSSKHGLKTNS